jgi:hypothetical protein
LIGITCGFGIEGDAEMELEAGETTGLEDMFHAFMREEERGSDRRSERGKVRRGMSEERAEMRSIDTVRRGGINT